MVKNRMLFLMLGMIFILIFLLNSGSVLADIPCQTNIITNAPNADWVLNFAVPWWDWNGIIVDNATCESISHSKFFLKYTEANGAFLLVGIRAYILLAFILIILILFKIAYRNIYK